MLKKLRFKFIIINMLLVSVVLIFTFASISLNTFNRLEDDVFMSLNRSLQMDDKNHIHPQIGGEIRDPEGSFTAVVVAEVDKFGNIAITFNDNATMEKSILHDAVKSALSQKDEEGIIPELHLYYSKRTMFERTKIAFADSDYVFDYMRRLLLNSIGIGIVSLSLLLLISIFLSQWALKPVEKAWQQQKQFIADASHELKTPLTVIMANNDILKMHPNDTIRQQEKWINSTHDEVLHMRRLVDDMLFLAQSDASQTKLVMSQINLSELIMECVLQFEPVFFEKGVLLESDIDQEIYVLGDIQQLKQLVTILLDNACKYAGVNGRAYISLTMQNTNAVLKVVNDGTIIQKEELPHLFERFYRSDKARTREGGYGLGLPIANSIVTNHKGSITASSDKVNGTVFTVTIERIA